jgi:hypothetical protein
MLKIAMVECLGESSVECQVGSSSNTHPTSNPLHKDVSDDLGWVLTKLLFILHNKKTTDFFAESDFSIIFAAEIIICS